MTTQSVTAKTMTNTEVLVNIIGVTKEAVRVLVPVNLSKFKSLQSSISSSRAKLTLLRHQGNIQEWDKRVDNFVAKYSDMVSVYLTEAFEGFTIEFSAVGGLLTFDTGDGKTEQVWHLIQPEEADIDEDVEVDELGAAEDIDEDIDEDIEVDTDEDIDEDIEVDTDEDTDEDETV